MLIKSFGLYWSQDAVHWGKKGPGGASRLEGQVKMNKEWTLCDFWNEKGVYVLYEEFRCIYIGKAIGTPLGTELSNRCGGRFAGRWDTFSWFGLGKRVAQDDKLLVKAAKSNGYDRSMKINPPGQRIIDAGDIVDALEALTILLVNPVLNRRQEKLVGAVEFEQVGQDSRRTLRQMIGSLSSEINDLRATLSSKRN